MTGDGRRDVHVVHERVVVLEPYHVAVADGIAVVNKAVIQGQPPEHGGIDQRGGREITAGNMHVRDGAAACAHIGNLNAERWYAARRALLTLNQAYVQLCTRSCELSTKKPKAQLMFVECTSLMSSSVHMTDQDIFPLGFCDHRLCKS